MRIAIAGGTGFIGKALTAHLIEKNYEVFILTRDKKIKNPNNVTYVEWLTESSVPEHELYDIDAIVNLAGESINSGRWTRKRKEDILQSRIQTTRALQSLIQKLDQKPTTFVNASAIGFYGTSMDRIFTELNLTPGSDFLAQTTYSWESEASKVEKLGIRTVFTRFGIVLDKEGGALPRIAAPYQFFAGGTVGSGKQWLSWIHLKDAIRMITFAIENRNIRGPLNVTAPHPVTMETFGKQLATVLQKPHWIPAPGFALRILLGEMSLLVLEGQQVLPKKAEENGFTFEYIDLEEALQNIYEK